MDTILDNTSGENYFDTHALDDFVSMCLHTCQQVSARELLGFMVHERGIEVVQNSLKAIDEAVPPTNKT